MKHLIAIALTAATLTITAPAPAQAEEPTHLTVQIGEGAGPYYLDARCWSSRKFLKHHKSACRHHPYWEKRAR